jgi:hypothetical protein
LDLDIFQKPASAGFGEKTSDFQEVDLRQIHSSYPTSHRCNDMLTHVLKTFTRKALYRTSHGERRQDGVVVIKYRGGDAANFRKELTNA